jgi:hypothetical protein
MLSSYFKPVAPNANHLTLLLLLLLLAVRAPSPFHQLRVSLPECDFCTPYVRYFESEYGGVVKKAWRYWISCVGSTMAARNSLDCTARSSPPLAVRQCAELEACKCIRLL